MCTPEFTPRKNLEKTTQMTKKGGFKRCSNFFKTRIKISKYKQPQNRVSEGF